MCFKIKDTLDLSKNLKIIWVRCISDIKPFHDITNNICMKISPNNLGTETKLKETNPNYNLGRKLNIKKLKGNKDDI